jgi:multiple sugar transport system permease protein
MMSVGTVATPTTRGWQAWRVVGRLSLYVIAVLLAVVFAIPAYWTAVGAVKSVAEIRHIPPVWIPSRWQWEDFRLVWQNVPFGTFYRNTLIVTGLATLGQVLTASIVGYGFARFRVPGGTILFMLILGTIMFPPELTLVPTFVLFKHLNWLDTLKPLIVPYWFGGGAFFIFLFRQFFMSLPQDLIDSARLDGAGHFRVFWEIAAPLTMPAYAAAAIISFFNHWNDFVNPLIFLNSTEKYTLALGIRAFTTGEVGLSGVPQDNLFMAAALMMILPTVVVFIFAQRYFIRGIVATGLKG